MAVENMSHWGQLFRWKLISAPFCLENKKVGAAGGGGTHHTRATHLSGCFSLGHVAAAGGREG